MNEEGYLIVRMLLGNRTQIVGKKEGFFGENELYSSAIRSQNRHYDMLPLETHKADDLLVSLNKTSVHVFKIKYERRIFSRGFTN